MRFQWWKEIEKTIRLARSIENELGKDEIEKMGVKNSITIVEKSNNLRR